MKYTENEIINIIKDHDLKNTPHRMAVLMRISKAKVPVAAHKIIEDLKKKNDIDQATVYRNLASLEEAGAIKRFDFNHGHAHYELNTEEIYHKIICNKCENMEKINAVYFDESLRKLIKKSKKFSVYDAMPVVDIYGLCKNCS